MKNHVSITVTGKVQGVAYRMSAKDQAGRLGVTGYAMNCGDGSVCIEAEGEQKKLDEFITWCKVGPQGSDVQHVNSTSGEVKGYAAFEIRRMGV
ncbi:MAG: acylphosphatase [Candidatus Uhrbacteria bacterium]|nr:acylphosphatase [Candidatus Uhrbacteria bacterium]